MDERKNYPEAVTIPCPPGRRPCMYFHCTDAALPGGTRCVKHPIVSTRGVSK